MELEFERKDRVSRTRAASSPAPIPSTGPSGSRAGLILRVDDGPIEHFRDQVIGGRGACVLAASEFDGFARRGREAAAGPQRVRTAATPV